ncbi:ATPase AAA [Anaerocolumna cellulosilytica]|uniref:ATPase AAA n=1 Tax=Anaerocolumna cellulosilytica TaxID=433286 RepID=A0A6S6QUZ3_9FIRM|nr:AAA family ATPase [Anaerocolumna cellulosilytica]MBB5194562.1 putative ATPase [Anaerocolumna cellulosilytica]BCJ93506.1 ATPase AAA [Anaerocolumna cellulosilytica]
MVYLKSFSLPNQYHIDMNLLPSAYPSSVFYFKELTLITFERITIFYGGNGSGKSTLLNLISDKLGLQRITTVDRSKEFHNFLHLCKYGLEEEEELRNGLPEGSKIISSEDIMDHILNQRINNKATGISQEKSFEEYMKYKFSDFHYRNLEDYENLKKVNTTRRLTATKYVNTNAGTKSREFSNGENALNYFDRELKEGNLYILDEPENSLSPRYQFELTKLLTDMARFFNCQFIIATHSPFILSAEGARIYNLDEEPVEIRRWEELESIRFYHDFFKERDKYF